MEKESKNFSETAYLRVKEYLLHSDIYPGQKIPHLELGKRLRISLTPLRESFVRLSTEGLLSHQNQKGFFVPKISLEEAKELYEIRELIEPYMAEKAAQSMTEDQMNSLLDILNEYKKLIAGPYTRQRLLVDKRFHVEIAKWSGNKKLSQILDRIYDQIIIKRQIMHLPSHRGQAAYKEHLEVFKSLEKRDGKKAAALMKDHIRTGRDFVMGHIEQREEFEFMNMLRPIKSS